MSDAAIRLAYVVAHRMLRTWWFVRRPETFGTLVAIWHGGEVLLVRNSYRRPITLPGGYRRPHETPQQAGRRELKEEVGIEVPAERLTLGFSGSLPFEFRTDTLDIVELTVPDRPALRVDNREVVWAGFATPEDALALPLVPHLRLYLERRAARP